MAEVEIGVVTDFFARPVVAAVTLTGPLKVGERIKLKGHTTDLEMVVESMQVEHLDVTEAKSGDAIGIKVLERVRKGDRVYKMTP